MTDSELRELPGMMESCLREYQMAEARGDYRVMEWAVRTWDLFADIYAEERSLVDCLRQGREGGNYASADD